MSPPNVRYIRQRPDGGWDGAPGKHGPADEAEGLPPFPPGLEVLG